MVNSCLTSIQAETQNHLWEMPMAGDAGVHEVHLCELTYCKNATHLHLKLRL